TAVCGKTPVTYVKQRLDIQPGAEQEQDLSCPPGKFVYSGGIDATKRQHSRLDSVFPAGPDGNTAYGGHYSTSKAQKQPAHAACGPNETTRVADDSNGLPAGAQAGNDVECPDGTRVYGGGAVTSSTYPYTKLNTIAPVPPPKGGDNGWFEGF